MQVRMLAFTRYYHYQYYMAYIAIKGGRAGMMYCADVWARGAAGGG